jgi:hypothetical protein
LDAPGNGAPHEMTEINFGLHSAESVRIARHGGTGQGSTYLRTAIVLASWFPVLSSQFLVPGSRFPSSWFSVPGSRFPVLSSWFSVLGSRFLVPEFAVPVLGSWFPVPVLVLVPVRFGLVLGSWFRFWFWFLFWFLVLVLGSWFPVPGSQLSAPHPAGDGIRYNSGER